MHVGNIQGIPSMNLYKVDLKFCVGEEKKH